MLPRPSADKLPPGPKLDVVVAEKVMGWKNVHRHSAGYIGKKPAKLGRWRSTEIPNWSTNPVPAYQLEERFEQVDTRTSGRRWLAQGVFRLVGSLAGNDEADQPTQELRQ